MGHIKEHMPSVLPSSDLKCSLGVCEVCGGIGQVRNDWVTEAGSLPSGSFTVSLDITAIHVEGTGYYDIVSWWLMGGKGMVSSRGQGEGFGGSGSWGALGGFRVGYEEGDGIPPQGTG